MNPYEYDACPWASRQASLHQLSGIHIDSEQKQIDYDVKLSSPCFSSRYGKKRTIFNLKGIKIHIVTINIEYNLQMTTGKKSVS